ncbi:MAG: PHP domain-containing protein [Clostridia bacterium]|nr:PHP domain-containing protein [Clostridia bacterium]
MYLIAPHQQQFKANLHCHSTYSDGKLTPEELKAAYQAHGYQILAITDHESPKNHNRLSDDDFLMLTGYEAYIRPDPNCAYDVFSPEIHLNLFAKNADNESIVCYNRACCKYIAPEAQDRLTKVGTSRTREYSVEYINEFIRTARENGYLVAYNHPVWSMESEERIAAYDGIFSMEMINGNSDTINGLEYNGALYDKLLRGGKRWFVHGADYNHNVHPFDDPRNDSFIGATIVLADTLSYDTVIEAMERGDMYATSGPRFHEVSFDGTAVHVSCSEVESVYCHIGSKAPAHVHAEHGTAITEATLPVHPNARYIRISITDKDGRRADTRAFFRDELGLPSL